MHRFLALVAAVILGQGVLTTADAQILNYDGTIEASDSLQTGRIIRNGVASFVGVVKPFPGITTACFATSMSPRSPIPLGWTPTTSAS